MVISFEELDKISGGLFLGHFVNNQIIISKELLIEYQRQPSNTSIGNLV